MITILQRYLLQALSVSTSIPASGNANVAVVTPIIPLSGRWTVRLRGFATSANPLDNSGQLQVTNFNSYWNFLTAGGVSLFSISPFEDTAFTPTFQFPAVSGSFVSKFADIDQIVASTDQIGGVVAGLQANSSFFVHNIDATNPHPVQAIVQTIIEFALPGAS